MIHTLEGAAELVELTFSRNRNSRPSALFRRLRRMREWQVFGDYPLLATLFAKAGEMSVPINRNQIRHTLNQSAELRVMTRRDKKRIMDALEVRPLVHNGRH